MSGGVAVIRVGAPTEAEMKAKKEALDDAISSTKAAVAEGIVPVGGLALLRCVDAVSREEAASEGDERTGVQILKRALEAPARQIAENSATAAAWWLRECSAVRSISASMPRARNSSILARPASSIQPRPSDRAGERGVGRKRAPADGGDNDRGFRSPRASDCQPEMAM